MPGRAWGGATIAHMADTPSRSLTIRGRIGVALTALGFVLMMLEVTLNAGLPTLISLVGVLLFIAGILMMLIRGGDDAIDATPDDAESA